MRNRFDALMITMILSFSIALFILIGLGIAACPHLERTALLTDSVRSASPLGTEEALARHEQVRAAILRGGELDAASEEETAHLRDVRRAVEILIGIALLGIAIGIGALRARPIDYRMIARRVSMTIIAMIMLIGAFMLILGFEPLFYAFESLLFAEGSFVFPMDSFLITLYPRIFFAHMTVWTFGLMLAIMIIVFLVSSKNRSSR